LAKEFNRLVDIEYERVRDFLILHYHLNQRDDSDLWRYCRNMQVPESLKLKIDLFRQRGHIDVYKYGLFAPPSWISVFIGQGLEQQMTEPYAYNMSQQEVENKMREISANIKKKLILMPQHSDFILDYCPSKSYMPE
jgi:tryptophan 7-halogenase